MTDQPERYIDPRGYTLEIAQRRAHSPRPRLHLAISPNPADLAELPVPVLIPTADLLTMIDAIDPDGVRAYLRETVRPETITLNVNPGTIDNVELARNISRTLEAHRVTPEQLDAVPEADGPDDRPCSSCDPEHDDEDDPTDTPDGFHTLAGEPDAPEPASRRDDPTERAQLDRAWALERAVALFPKGYTDNVLKIAAWIIDGQER